MVQSTHSARLPRLRSYVTMLAIVWSGVIVGSLAWNVYQVDTQVREIARVQARVMYQKDLILRRWASAHGGVYVPVSDITPPNPYLQVAERDIQTPSGRWLTLMNPAYMTRQIHELQDAEMGARGHITSLCPIRPQNAADEWETKALYQFEQGVLEVSEVALLEGRPYMRLMRPLVTEASCLNCHAAQGYRLGDIRGGISVAILMEPLWQIQRNNTQSLVIVHGILWLLGLATILFGHARVRQSETERARVEERLRFISSHDALSKLYNRASYEEQVVELERSTRAPISVIMIDVDGLKETNDTWGHAAGDELIQRTSQVIKAAIRTDDIAARIGGDEFAVLLPGADREAAQQVLVRLKAQLASNNLAHSQHPLSFSVGVATAETADALRQAIKVADAQMYVEKRMHANRASMR